MHKLNKSREHGQSSVEFVIIFVLFAALITGIFEMTRVFRLKHTLNTATFTAVRAGALNNARLEPMNAELANGMGTIFSQTATAEGFTSAIARSRVFATALRAAGGGIQIVSPTQDIFDQLKKTQFLPTEGEPGLRRVEVIPNDNLRWRPQTVAQVDVGGNSFDINIQDANLLKVRSLWCHRMVVPALDLLIYTIVNTPPFVSPRQVVCNAISIGGGAAPEAVPPGYYLAIAADATLRMQSPVSGEDLP